MAAELESVVLTVDKADSRLRAGDIGTVVMVHRGGEAYEVEFVTLGGETIAVLTLADREVRPAGPSEIPHARVIA